MKRLATAAALALGASLLAAAPAHAAEPVSRANCIGGMGDTATDYAEALLTRACVVVQYNPDTRRATGTGLALAGRQPSAVTQVALFRRPCGGSWTRVAYAADADGWHSDPRDAAQVSAARGATARVQWYASDKLSTRYSGTVVSKRLKSGVAGAC